MSGIAGIVRLDAGRVDPAQVTRMTEAMAFRGPDGTAQWTSPSVVLAQLAFCTTAESQDQIGPLANESGESVIVMDGRLDNAPELRRTLQGRGVTLRNRSDTELVLKAYETWGADCLGNIDGDFAFAIWDQVRRVLYCARDRFGHRPFYYWRIGDQIVFASDFHAVLAVPGSPRRINEGMLAEYLSVYPQHLDQTLIVGVDRLPPAKWLRASRGRCETGTYWTVDCNRREYAQTETQYVEQFEELFQHAVRCRTRSLGLAGIYLSGGVDSSSIFCTAARPGGAESPLAAFSLTFPGAPATDETAYIAAAGKQAGIRAQTLTYAPVPFQHFVAGIRQFKDVGDAPNGRMLDPIRTLAKTQGARVMLTGSGGDEWFGRNKFYLAELLRDMDLRGLARELGLARTSGSSAGALLQMMLYHGLSPLLPQPLHRPVRLARRWLFKAPARTSTGAGGFVHPDLAARVSLEERLRARDKCTPRSTPSHRDLHQVLHGGLLVKSREVDSRGLALLGIEERHPFYDRRLVEFSFALPERLRSQDSGKYILRKAMKDVLPESIRTRTDKADFSHVIADTLMDPAIADWVPCHRLHEAGFVDAAEINKQYALFRHYYLNHASGYMALSWKLWAAISLEIWMSVLNCK